MKNWFKITMLAALAAPLACSEVEVDEAPLKAVSFNVGTYSPQTRAEGDPVSVIDQDGIEAFSCRAYLHAQGFAGTAQESSDFFGPAPTTISWHSDTKEWLPPHDYYWPKGSESYVDFISWYGGNPTISYSKTGTTYGATFSWNLTEPLATTENLMWADVAWRYKANVNPATYGKNYVEEGVPTLFHHALAQVYFQARLSKVSDGDVSWEVKVTDFKLTKVRKTGSFSLKISDPGTNKTSAWEAGTESEIGWTGLSGAGEISASITDPITLSGADTKILGWSSVLPQDLDETGNEVGISITYTVTTKYGTTVKTVEEPVPAVNALLKEFKTGTGENDYIKKWERNKRYTYTIIIDPDTGVIKLIPVETDWVDAGSFDLTV